MITREEAFELLRKYNKDKNKYNLIFDERYPENYKAPTGQFNSNPFIMPEVDIETLRLNLEDEWFDAPLILDPVTVSSQ